MKVHLSPRLEAILYTLALSFFLVLFSSTAYACGGSCDWDKCDPKFCEITVGCDLIHDPDSDRCFPLELGLIAKVL